jgi:hypothetical protein
MSGQLRRGVPLTNGIWKMEIKPSWGRKNLEVRFFLPSYTPPDARGLVFFPEIEE